jgi:putative nucleotidyltransferase with HDIG domain
VVLSEYELAQTSTAGEELRRKALGALGDLPPFSAILNRVMASLAGENVSFHKLGDLVEKDTVIAGNLLHLVNSALYARREAVNSVRHALSLLGIEKVRNAILSMSLSRMWRTMAMPAQFSMARFNMHSAAVAILADLAAQRLPVAYPEGAFVAGLLHDVGRLMIARALPEHLARIEALHDSSGRPRIECETEVLGFTHAELSADALEQWHLPPLIRTAVLNHHAPENDDPPAREIALSRLIDAANQYVNSTGASIGIAPEADCAEATRLESLGLEDEISRVISDFQAEYAAMSGFFV